MEHEAIKIGRIKREIEKAVKADLGEDVDVYASQGFLDDLARKHPSDYLHILDEASSILRHPHYVGYDAANQELLCLRDYIAKDSFVKVALVITKSERWFIQGISAAEEKKIAFYINSHLLCRLS